MGGRLKERQDSRACNMEAADYMF